MYIGDKKIEAVMDKEDGLVEVGFIKAPSVTIKKELLEELQTEKVGQGNITDNINNYFARKFLAELAYHNLDFYFGRAVGTAMEVLSHNLREQCICEKFKTNSTDNIKLREFLGL